MRNNYTYVYGILVLSILCLIGGFVSIQAGKINPYGVGIIFMGLFLIIQYIKITAKVPRQVIRFLTWVVVLGFLIVDIVLLW